MRVADALVRLARWSLVTVAALLGIIVAVAGLGQRAPQPPPVASGSWATPKELGDFIAQRSAHPRLAGLAVVVLRDGDVYEESYLGTAGAGRPVTADTPFVLGSTRKQFTGLAVQRLIAEGRLALDTTVSEVLPDVEADGDVGHMSVRQLLTHTSGLTTTTGLEQWGWTPGRSPSIADNVHALISAAAGKQGTYEYSNSNYDLLGPIIEEVTAQPFAAAVDGLVLGPLRLPQTTAGPDSTTLDDIAVGYHSWLEVVTVPTPCPCTPGAVPSAFMVSTAADLTRLLQAHMGSVPTDLPDEILATAREPLTSIDPYWADVQTVGACEQVLGHRLANGDLWRSFELVSHVLPGGGVLTVCGLDENSDWQFRAFVLTVCPPVDPA